MTIDDLSKEEKLRIAQPILVLPETIALSEAIDNWLRPQSQLKRSELTASLWGFLKENGLAEDQ